MIREKIDFGIDQYVLILNYSIYKTILVVFYIFRNKLHLKSSCNVHII